MFGSILEHFGIAFEVISALFGIVSNSFLIIFAPFSQCFWFFGVIVFVIIVFIVAVIVVVSLLPCLPPTPTPAKKVF